MQHDELQRIEREYLACIYQRASYLDEKEARLKPTDLWAEKHREWYAALVRIYESGGTQQGIIDWARLADELGTDAAIELGNIEISTPTLAFDRARRIRSEAQRRTLTALAKRIVVTCENGGSVAQVAELIEEMRNGVNESDAGDLITHREALKRTINHLDETSTPEHGGAKSPICGHSILNPYRAGELVIIAGRPGMSKTSFAWQECAGLAEQGQPGLVVSLEMSPEEMLKRELSRRSQITTERMQSGMMSDYEHRQINEGIKLSMGLPIYWSTQVAGVSVSTVTSWVRRLKRQGHDLRWLVIDYLQLMQAPRAERREQAIAAMSRGLKLAAMELGITVILLTQLNRECEKRPDKRPHVSDLRESGAIEQDADKVLLMWRPGQYPELREKFEASDHRVIVAKQRGGSLGEVALRWHGSTTSFSNPHGHQEAAE